MWLKVPGGSDVQSMFGEPLPKRSSAYIQPSATTASLKILDGATGSRRLVSQLLYAAVAVTAVQFALGRRKSSAPSRQGAHAAVGSRAADPTSAH